MMLFYEEKVKTLVVIGFGNPLVCNVPLWTLFLV